MRPNITQSLHAASCDTQQQINPISFHHFISGSISTSRFFLLLVGSIGSISVTPGCFWRSLLLCMPAHKHWCMWRKDQGPGKRNTQSLAVDAVIVAKLTGPNRSRSGIMVFPAQPHQTWASHHKSLSQGLSHRFTICVCPSLLTKETAHINSAILSLTSGSEPSRIIETYIVRILVQDQDDSKWHDTPKKKKKNTCISIQLD